MNWIKRLFNWKKSPKATNEMKPVEMGKYIDGDKLRLFVLEKYNTITKKWHKSPKNYYLWLNDDGSVNLLKFEDNPERRGIFRNLYEWYNMYNGQKDNN